MAAEIEYFDKADIPCPKLGEAAGMADRLAEILKRSELDTHALTAICLRCGIKIKRFELPDGRISYLPGKGWPEKCRE